MSEFDQTVLTLCDFGDCERSSKYKESEVLFY